MPVSVSGPQAGAHPAAVLSTPSMPLAPRFAATGAPTPAATAPWASSGSADPGPDPRPAAPLARGARRGAVAYMSMSRMGMLLPRNRASPAKPFCPRIQG